MKTYLCGGAVRDMLLGCDPKDKDYVVVGTSVQQMLDAGYFKVGADFPVFLHPVTGDEYALARRERSTGDGYLDFDVEFGADVTIEDDLFRRDLSINSMAMDGSTLIDPYNGKSDLDNKILRHTSDAFQEDPVRVLRLARFRARLGPDFKVATETRDMIHSMAKKGVLSSLQPDRVYKEMSRALMEDHPRLFFDTLLECDALQVIFPEIYRLKSALESYRYHPEGDAYEHTMLVLTQAAMFNYDLDIRYSCLVHDFGKGLTPLDKLPKHYGHDVNGVRVVDDFSKRLSVPTNTRELAKKATRYHMYCHKLDTLNPKTFVKMFDNMKVRNNSRMLDVLYYVGICDERGRLGCENNNYDHLDQLLDAYEAYISVSFAVVFPEGESNPNKIQDGLRRARIAAIAKEFKK